MKRLYPILFSLLIPHFAVHAEEASQGKALYDANCTRCHGTDVMTRSDRRVQNMQQLDAQVRRCEQNLNLQWFDDDIENVTRYVNEHFYKF